MFIPLTKVDAEQRLVYGVATGETLDRSGEICDYASTKPHYEKWSGDIVKATGGKSLGNVRAMHGKVAAGKVTSINFNDEAKQIEIAAKIVDDAEWAKVQEGVYTGFSQGGAYAKRWKDEAGLQRYTAEPSEVSLVDLPCLKEATFQMIKSAGAVEERHFKPVVEVSPSNDAIFAKASEMAKAADRETDVSAFFEPARAELVKAALPPVPEAPVVEATDVQTTPASPGDGLEQVWKARDGKTFVKKADAVAHNAEIDAKAATEPATKAVTDKLNEIAGKLGIEKSGDATGAASAKDPNEGKDQADGGGAGAMNANSMKSKKKRTAPNGEAMKAATVETLAKDLYTASRFAEMLAQLQGFQASAEYQAVFSGDQDDTFAGSLKTWVSQGCSLLVAMVQDEADDMADAADDVMEMVAGKLKPGIAALLGKTFAEIEPLKKIGEALAKAGARNSKADQDKIQAMHDHACDLGATCDSDNCEDDDMANAHAPRDLAKALDAMTADRDLAKARGDALQKTIDERIVPMLSKIGERIENIERQPQPLPFVGNLRAVSKGAEDQAHDDIGESLAAMAKNDPEAYRLLMIKLAQQQPQQMTLAR